MHGLSILIFAFTGFHLEGGEGTAHYTLYTWLPTTASWGFPAR